MFVLCVIEPNFTVIVVSLILALMKCRQTSLSIRACTYECPALLSAAKQAVIFLLYVIHMQVCRTLKKKFVLTVCSMMLL